MELTRAQALDLLKEYNKEPFHLRHALTVEAVMDWFARQLGYENEAGFWATAGLLHDLDLSSILMSTVSKSGRSWRKRAWTPPSFMRW